MRRTLARRPAAACARTTTRAYPYEISHAVHGALVGAVDNLDALRALVADAHVVHARAPFTLLRAALENSATAVWLLGRSSREDRLLRRLRLQWSDSLDGENVAKRTGQEPSLPRSGWKSKLETVARASGMADSGRRSRVRPGHVCEGHSIPVVPTAMSVTKDSF
jgi:hypothetical protein